MHMALNVVVVMVLEEKSVEHAEAMEDLQQIKFATSAVVKEDFHATVAEAMVTVKKVNLKQILPSTTVLGSTITQMTSFRF